MLGRRTELRITFVILILALLAAFVWSPLDSETQAIYTFRRRTNIGDAFIPMLSASLVAVAALAQLIVVWRMPKTDDIEASLLTPSSAAFYLRLFIIIMVGLLLMQWLGPIAVKVFGGADASYRNLRSTYPWKLIGFSAGSMFLVTGIIALIERKLTRRTILVGIFVTFLLILLFDIPFDGILLPPNGDW